MRKHAGRRSPAVDSNQDGCDSVIDETVKTSCASRAVRASAVPPCAKAELRSTVAVCPVRAAVPSLTVFGTKLRTPLLISAVLGPAINCVTTSLIDDSPRRNRNKLLSEYEIGLGTSRRTRSRRAGPTRHRCRAEPVRLRSQRDGADQHCTPVHPGPNHAQTRRLHASTGDVDAATRRRVARHYYRRREPGTPNGAGRGSTDGR